MDARAATNPIRRRKSLLSACNKSRSSSKQLIAIYYCALELHFSGVVTMQTYINQCIAHCSVHLPYCKTQQQSPRLEPHPRFPQLAPMEKRRVFALERTFFTLRDFRCRHGKMLLAGCVRMRVCATGFLHCCCLIAI